MVGTQYDEKLRHDDVVAAARLLEAYGCLGVAGGECFLTIHGRWRWWNAGRGGYADTAYDAADAIIPPRRPSLGRKKV